MDAIQRGVYYLNIKPRTKKEVANYLKDKGYTKEEIDDAITKLTEYHYIDDENYARLYFQYGYEKGRGYNRIKRELKEKGISNDIIEQVTYQLEDENQLPDQFEIALNIGKAVLGDISLSSLEYSEKKKIEAKVGRRLISRGFTNDIIYKVIRELSCQ